MNSYLLKDYSYTYPETLIAKEPLSIRHQSKMMVFNREQGCWSHEHFVDIQRFLPKNCLLVFNESKVIPARLYALKPSGGQVEILLVEKLKSGLWKSLAKPLKALKEGMRLTLLKRSSKQVSEQKIWVEKIVPGEFVLVRMPEDVLENILLQQYGEIPLPPYMRRTATYPLDETRYQTVYANQAGSVAAPTAGLHFSDSILQQLQNHGVEFAKVCLHVGPGTFLPIQCVDIREHRMHTEQYEVNESQFEKIKKFKDAGKSIICVGTTSLRVLETIFQTDSVVLNGTTDLFIKPGYHFKVATGLLTNFHQPESTLLVLVASLLGDRELLLKAYQEAIIQQYRLFSYGDCMLVI